MKKITTFIGALLFAAITISAFANAKHRVLPQVWYIDGSNFCVSAFAEVCSPTGVPDCEQLLYSDEAGNTSLGITTQIYQNFVSASQCGVPYERTTK